MTSRTIAGAEAKALGTREKWQLLSPYLRRHGREALAYATLQQGMEYFITPAGYIAFNTVSHPVFARRPRRIALSDPICAREDVRSLVEAFLAENPRAAFAVISEACAETLRGMGFKVNCVGYEPELPVQTYNTKGNWKELDLIKRGRNEARREGIVIREEHDISKLSRERFDRVTAQWISTKRVNDREIWLYARRPVYDLEEDVRKFVAYDKDGEIVGFVFYDPMYRDGRVVGYSANISRCDEKRYGRLATAIHMEAIEAFRRDQGVEVLNLCLAPFVKLNEGKYNDDVGTKIFFQVSERFGDDIYNFKGLSFHKSKYRGAEKSLYFASNNPFPTNDVYLAFLCSDITRSYFKTLGQLFVGMLGALKKKPAYQ
jgi:lysylphosphatidylglycerol synthetase-like protein (DUF2156 family)